MTVIAAQLKPLRNVIAAHYIPDMLIRRGMDDGLPNDYRRIDRLPAVFDRGIIFFMVELHVVGCNDNGRDV